MFLAALSSSIGDLVGWLVRPSGDLLKLWPQLTFTGPCWPLIDLGMTLGWLWDDLGMTLGWTWDDLGMNLGWPWTGFVDLGLTLLTLNLCCRHERASKSLEHRRTRDHIFHSLASDSTSQNPFLLWIASRSQLPNTFHLLPWIEIGIAKASVTDTCHSTAIANFIFRITRTWLEIALFIQQ